MYLVKIFKPENCSAEQLKVFYDIVLEGNQVNPNGLMNRIKAADFLSFCELDNKIVGVASIKNPDKNYKKSTFKKQMWRNFQTTMIMKSVMQLQKKRTEEKGLVRS